MFNEAICRKCHDANTFMQPAADDDTKAAKTTENFESCAEKYCIEERCANTKKVDCLAIVPFTTHVTTCS